MPEMSLNLESSIRGKLQRLSQAAVAGVTAVAEGQLHNTTSFQRFRTLGHFDINRSLR